MNVFIIPGNPPATYFYEMWGREMVDCGFAKSFKVAKYPCFEKVHSSIEYFKKVEDEHFENYKRYLESIEGPVLLVGHSLGEYFALKMLERQPELVEKCVLLHPFLRAPTSRGKNILRTVKRLRSIPFFEKVVMKSRPILERLSSDYKHLTDGELKACLNIVPHEFALLGNDKSPLAIAPNISQKLRVFYSENDTWCPTSTISQVETNVKSKNCQLSHEFIVSKSQRTRMLELIKD